MTKLYTSFILTLSLFISQVSAQEKQSRIELDNAVSMPFGKRFGDGATRIIGNVELHQDDIYMYCDSVYFYMQENNVKAYGNVHLIKGDSVEVFSDSLYHIGNKKLSMFRGNVKMNDKKVKLYTDSLDYDMITNRSYYFGGGKIVDTSATLTSKEGYYFSNQKKLFFKDSVVVKNDAYTMYTDTLEYHTETKRVMFKGPTTAVSDTNQLYAERGWYDTKNNIARVYQNTRYSNNKQTLDSDTLYYYREKGYGEAFSNVVLTSIEDSVILTSNYAFHDEINNSSLVTDSATLIQISKHDTTYLHADTMRTIVDSADGEISDIYAYYKVQLFSNKVQLRCDSVAFSFNDSVVRLFGNPVIWSDSSQLKSKHAHFNIVNNELTDLFLKENAIVIEEKDSIHYNQIKGYEITGHLKEHELKRAIVNRRSETIYYLTEDGVITSMNKTRCRQMDVKFKNGSANEIIWISEPNGKVFPLNELDKGNMYFNDFEWLDHLRPHKKEDIYHWKPYTPKK